MQAIKEIVFGIMLGITMMLVSTLAQASKLEEKMVPTTELTIEKLTNYLEAELTIQGVAEKSEVILIGSFPDILYRHEEPFAPRIEFARLNEISGQFTAHIVLETVPTNKQVQQLGQSFEVDGRFEPWLDIPVLRHRVSSGDVITEDDIAMVEMPSRKIRRNTVLESKDLVGLTPVRTLTANRPIDSDALERPAAIRRNDVVTVQYSTETMRLSVSAYAMEDAAIGDSISLRNSDSHNEIKGVVIGPALVEVPVNIRPLAAAM